LCQLIYKPAGFTIEKRLIESTCIVNPDGFGLMYYNNDTKDLQTFKLYNGDNDPEVLFPILEGLHDQDAFIHFRFRTKGEVNEDSCHPFQAYGENDRRVYLMHNGTISGYGSATEVDSKEFAEKLVGPLYHRFLLSGIRNPLQDEFYHEIVQKFIGSDSKVALLDNTGDSLIFNYQKGDVRKDKVQEVVDGVEVEREVEWWVSNTYSFNTSHRKSYTTYGADWGKGGSTNNGGAPFREVGTHHGGTTTTVVTETITKTGGTDNTKNQSSNDTSKARVTGSIPKRTYVKSYWQDVLKLQSIQDLQPMTRDHVSDLVDLEPENAKLLLNDLLIELFDNEGWEEDEHEDEIDPNEDA